MSKATSYLQLILPAFNEYYNSWWKPNNGNFQKIDDFAAAFGGEVTDARGTTTSLNERLSVVLNPDGTVKAIPEIEAAKSSAVYGYGTGSSLQSLDDRLEAGDLEIFRSRQGLDSLADLLAWANSGNKVDCLVSGPTNPLTYSGANVTLNGGTTPVVSSINGYRAYTEINDSVAISGASGTYYLTLTRNPLGKIYLTINTSNCSVGTGPVGSFYTKFTAPTNLITAGVKPGHILEITAPSGNANIGRWVVAETSAENILLTQTEVLIVGTFPAVSTGLNAQFLYPYAPTLGFTATPHNKSWAGSNGTAYVGRVNFNGTSVTSLTAYPYQAHFEAWSQVTPVGGDFSNSVSHNLGYVPKSVSIYASQANDFSQPLELLSVAKISSGAVSISSGTQTISYTSPTLKRSVVIEMTDTLLNIKNATNGLFYEDFSGSTQTTGYLYIVAER